MTDGELQQAMDDHMETHMRIRESGINQDEDEAWERYFEYHEMVVEHTRRMREAAAARRAEPQQTNLLAFREGKKCPE